MSEKILNSRIINKHDSAENWSKATNFTPKQGELIVYDIDSLHSYERIKVGDGITNVNDLPFAAVTSWDDLANKPFYIEREILFNQAVTLDADGVLEINEALDVSVGDIITITLDGEEHDYEALDSSGDGSVVIFGNTSVIGINSIPKDDGRVFVLTGTYNGQTSTYITVSNYTGTPIKIEKNIVHKISPRFLPNGGFGYQEKIVLFDKTINVVGGTYTADASFVINEGDIAIVVFDGVEYECPVWFAPDDESLVEFGGDECSAPFRVETSCGGSRAAIIECKTGTHSIKITRIAIHKIDNKFISDDIATIGYVSKVISEIPMPNVSGQISTHNTSTTAHNDIRQSIQTLSTKVGTSSVSEQITTAIKDKSDKDHTHNYAGSSSAGGAANSVKTNLTVKLNGGSTEGTDLFTYNGSTAKTVNITPSAIGAAASSHGNHVPTVETANNAKFLRNDNTWQTVTPANIGAAASSHGTHVSYSETAPVMDGTASAGSSSTVARSDHKHPVDTSRASATDLANLKTLVGNKSVSTQISEANIIYIGPTKPTDPNIKVWINTAEEGTGIVPVMPRVSTISLPKASWSGSASPYYQNVSINTVTSATKIELNPTVSQIVSLQNDDIALMAENTNGTVKVYSFGGKPSSDMTMQVTLTEVSYV